MFQVHVLPDWPNFLLQLASTGVLFLVLRHFLFTPVSNFLQERKEKISSDIKEAESQKVEASKLKSQYEAKIEEAKEEAKEIIESSRKRGDEIREEIVSDAKKEANNMIDKAKKEISREKEKAQQELKEEMVTVAMLAASKVIDENLDDKKHKDMINKFIDEVGENQWQN